MRQEEVLADAAVVAAEHGTLSGFGVEQLCETVARRAGIAGVVTARWVCYPPLLLALAAVFVCPYSWTAEDGCVKLDAVAALQR